MGAGQARALRLAGLRSGALALGPVFPCCVLRGGLLAEALGKEGREDLAGGVGVEVGQGVDDDSLVAVGVGQDDAAVEAGGAGPDDEALAHEVGGEAEAAGGVVVTGGQDHPGALGQATQRLIQEGDGVIGRDGAVVDVPGDEDGINRLGGDELDEVVGEGGVRVIEHAPVEGAPQVPVGGVEDPHADTVSQPTDSGG